jgi:TrmH family RNA methyltransferase
VAAGEIGHRHPQARRLRALLHDPATRRAESAFVLEGPRLVADALDRGVELESVWIGANARQAFGELLTRVEAGGFEVHELKEGVLERLGSTRTPQPVLAIAAIPPPVALDAVPPGVVVVTDEVQDPGNLGTIVRSAEAAGAVAVVVGRGSQGVDPWNPKVVRGSAGAILGLPVLAVDEPARALVVLRGRGFRAIGAAAAAAEAYTDVDLTGPVAIVIGSESHVIGPEIAAELDATVVIPMAGPTESLNAAVAASILLFEAARQARTGPGRPSPA